MAKASPAILQSINKQLGRLAGLFAIAGGIALVGLMGITVVAVFARYVMNDPIFGIEDLSSMTLTVVVAAAVAYGAYHNVHVSVSVIKMFAGRRVTRVTDLIVRFLSLAFISIAAYAMFTKGACGLPCGQITNNLSIVHTPFYYSIGLALAFYALLLAFQIIVGLAHWTGRDPNEAID